MAGPTLSEPSGDAEGASVDPAEIAKFSRLAAEWWDPEGTFKPLHRFNPVRLGFIRSLAAEHFGRDGKALRPFGGLDLLDIGCGGGLLSEPMARMGFSVLGADASERNVRVAAAHAEGAGLPLRYRAVTAEALAAEGAAFDLILNMEVVEHVADLPLFLRSCAALLKPQGLMLVATLNRTLKSLALAKIGAEYILRWLPPGTHDWNRFVTPAELTRGLEAAGLGLTRLQGVAFDPLRWDWILSPDTGVNYLAVAVKRSGAFSGEAPSRFASENAAK
jgi:2-polyprenyl-6-hydroxyphenyl methylase / 3-demethylubiquinone-9 3-methyltransferase